MSNVVVLLDWSPPVVGNLTILIEEETTDIRIGDGEEISLDLIGGAYDEDTEDVNVTLSEQVVGSDSAVSCTYTTMSASSWLARCNVLGAAASARLCFTATATNGAGLTASSSSCLTIDASSPEWLPAAPVLYFSGTDGGVLAVDFYMPSEPHASPCAIELAVCYASQCSEYARIYANGSAGSFTQVSVPLPVNLLGQRGAVWVKMIAVNRAGLRSATATSNCVVAGAYPPEIASVELGPRTLMNGLDDAYLI